MAAGSNGQVAWGFTNSYGDFADARWGKCASTDYGVRREHHRGEGRDAVEVTYRDVGAGVVLDGEDYADDVASGECLQAAWLATRPEATNFGLLDLERARGIDDVLALAPRIGIPGQNMVIGDSRGRIAWTLLGRVPRTAGPDRLFGALEYRDAVDHPRIADPPVGRLWTANQRVVAGELEAVLGDDEVDVGAGGYDIGARARQIRDDLLSLAHPATEADMLAIQLDSRGLVPGALARSAARAHRRGRDARRAAAPRVSRAGQRMAREASADAVGYRLVRTFRGNTLNALWRSLSTGLLGARFEERRPAPVRSGRMAAGERAPDRDRAAWWRRVARVPAAAARCDHRRAGERLRHARAPANTASSIRSPCAIRCRGAVPLLSKLLDMPTLPLAGDHHMPRVQDGSFGASERFAVSPGRERDGYLQLPGGPSGHPLSPFYRSGFDDWAGGVPTPFLPGPAAHKLVLRPDGAATP